MSEGAFILMLCPSKESMLLGLRSNDAKWSPNTWCPFGGTLEQNESYLDAAMREYREETAILPNSYAIYDEPICELNGTACDGEDGVMKMYIGVMADETNPFINDETQDSGWFLIKDLSTLNLHPILKKFFSDSFGIELVKKMFTGDNDYVQQ